MILYILKKEIIIHFDEREQRRFWFIKRSKRGKKKEFRSPKICSIIRVAKITSSFVIKQRVNELF